MNRKNNTMTCQRNHNIFAAILRLQPAKPSLLLLSSALLINGCNFTTPIPDTPLNLPQDYSQTTTAEQTSPLPDQWWQTFNDPALNLIIEEALVHNFNIRSSWARIEQARATAIQAGAALYPNVDFTSRGSRTRNEINSPSSPGQPANTTYSNSFSVGLAASYEIDLWSRIQTSQQASVAELNASKLDLQAAAITLSSQITSNWYKLIDQHQQRRILNQQIEVNEKHLEVLQVRFNAGLIGAPDILQQKQLLESTIASRYQVDSQIEVIENQLAILLGYPPNEATFDVPENLPSLPPLPNTGIPADLLNRRPDVLAAYMRVEASNYRIASAIADRLPKLSLTVSGSTDAAHLEDLFDNWLATFAANIAEPIFDAGRKEAEVDKQKAINEINFASWNQTILTALQDVENALVQEKNQQSYLESLRSQLKIATAVEEETRNNYYKGNGDFLRVLNAQQSLQNLQRQVSTAHQQLIEHRVSLCRALAGGWDMQKPQPLTTTKTN
ncbi:efflux transporter outer membrane subunit [Planctomycetota bacterium]|nr:efflux transporter outer membrane subunit [Planctomycetota bacterium]